ncbi:hypothetical protein HUA74_26905 [Myxococcus sp. CA051A]|uniref:hypothetical protein n=1 Tax=unclassified Myxococcus TaxID=2648731 RepID=UPI00157B7D77|nr:MULTISPECIES: hypothetical protein [unclassified Myxococcus]NTX41690.1 hypothetical protein [Myxococcus sp. CA033]NTX53940.1 hypothetical protein [Myxococcus sp. CA039A]NTX64290.1 hypothetical protein [Myxococcus sp. CA051A]
MKKLMIALAALLGVAGLVMAVPAIRQWREDWQNDDRGLEPGGLLGFGIPAKPLPGQATPPCTGGSLGINGGCWEKVELWLRDCGSVGYVHEGGCYVPAKTAQTRVPPG